MTTTVTRKATAADIGPITSLFRTTVETINSKDYTAEQVAVWSAGASQTEKWLRKMEEQYFLVALLNKVIAGFASITDEGYLGFLYIHKDYQRRGIALTLMKALEAYARKQGVQTIYSNVSITAKGFFEKQGFRETATQKNDVQGIILVNYRMEKLLHR